MKKIYLITLQSKEILSAAIGGTFQDVPGGGYTQNPDSTLYYENTSTEAVTVVVIAEETNGGTVIYQQSWAYDFLPSDAKTLAQNYGAKLFLQYPYRSGMAAKVMAL